MFMYGICIGADVIDEGYRGEIKVILVNHINDIFRAKRGDRIVQLIVEKKTYCEIKEVKKLTDIMR
ncbi:hypothetical protein CL6EHI_104880 [Entamoeba histolytica]|uniref:dUTP diphosphatase n=2 Tax=Entamoeba histolytica TaxID=5759 RepID=A0A175JMB3_ENTHI|nr:deoxyuridine 5'triphosphate nucleotidohydrolase mitochondrial precursor, putative [Entamoeba histolytica KU27]GAT94870.1 hypothetical protein CL6EHI_104880 [Entamoeba histolytica]